MYKCLYINWLDIGTKWIFKMKPINDGFYCSHLVPLHLMHSLTYCLNIHSIQHFCLGDLPQFNSLFHFRRKPLFNLLQKYFLNNNLHVKSHSQIPFFKTTFSLQKELRCSSIIEWKRDSVKSVAHTRPSWVRRIESLLISLWITPCVWRTDSAFRTDRQTVAICSSFILKREGNNICKFLLITNICSCISGQGIIFHALLMMFSTD